MLLPDQRCRVPRERWNRVRIYVRHHHHVHFDQFTETREDIFAVREEVEGGGEEVAVVLDVVCRGLCYD